MPRSEPSILFICTGNIYRSRFAEALFNHHAEEIGLPQRAFSRGLAPHLADEPVLSLHTRSALRARGIDLRHTGSIKRQLVAEDLEAAGHPIALSRDEHLPMVRTLFPDWEDRITFWDVEDLHLWPSTRALPRIESQVEALLSTLAEKHAGAA